MGKLTNDTLYERETHLSYNELEEEFMLETYDTKLKNRFAKNKNVIITEKEDTGIGTRYEIRGNKGDLNIDIYK